MSEACARAILRIIAVVTMLIGITQLVSTLITLMVAGPGAVGGREMLLLGAPLVILAEGWLLFVVSPAIAQRVVQP